MTRLLKYLIFILTSFLLTESLFASGALFVRPVRSTGEYEKMSIRTFDATVAINDQVAETHVDQVFFNSMNTTVESTFIFPLPENAVITDLFYWFNGVRYQAEIKIKEEAQQAYDNNISRLIDPALLQEIGDNLFKLNIAPINARSEVRFEITYVEMLPYEFGLVEYEFFSTQPVYPPIRCSAFLCNSMPKPATASNRLPFPDSKEPRRCPLQRNQKVIMK